MIAFGKVGFKIKKKISEVKYFVKIEK